MTLLRQANLNGDVTTALVGLLKTGHSKTRSYAVKVLREQPNLLDDNVKDLIHMLRDAQLDENIRNDISPILIRQAKLSANNVAALLAIFKAASPHLQVPISLILGKPSNSLSPLVILDLERLLRSSRESDQIAAAKALCGQSNLPDDDIKVLMTLLRSQNSEVLSTAAILLGNQTNLHDEAIMSLVSTMEYPRGDASYEAFRALRNRTDLPDSITTALIKLFVHKSDAVRSLAAGVMEIQSQVSRKVAKLLLSLLRSADGTEYFSCAGTMGGRPVFLDKVLDALGLPLQPRRSATASTLGPSLEDIETLYTSFFYRSFNEQFWVQVNNDGILSLHQPSGTRVASIPNLTPDIVLGWRRKLADSVAKKAGSQKYSL
ncbi:hypothetical protein F5B22DRAFT_661798 [Xylaria bambusicola]|uniref:uncharacterized protein n=1 Tax=Xylaria bambusicola TaxID=326684 RepID=UPI002007D8EA|nr:uncharacterized protein F5B22DRAFT_661798 [Xylaria bambusicola]KAI0505237.1 hypothetical protein F5B22DRAFT_661798 [Xylaria bambusicola]